MRNQAGERINSGESGVGHGDLSRTGAGPKARRGSCDMHVTSCVRAPHHFLDTASRTPCRALPSSRERSRGARRWLWLPPGRINTGSLRVISIWWPETSRPESNAPHYWRWLRNGTAWPICKSAPPICGTENH